MTIVKLDKFHTNKKGVNLNEETLYDFFMLQNQETYMLCFTFQFSMWHLGLKSAIYYVSIEVPTVVIGLILGETDLRVKVTATWCQ